MARSFNGSSAVLSASAPITAAPLTMATWFYYPTDNNTSYCLMALADTGTTNHRFSLEARAATAGNPLTLAALAGGTESISSISGMTAGAWMHGAGVVASATSRVAYLNGSAATAATSTRTPTGIDALRLGALETSAGVSAYLAGQLAESAIWDAALSAEEIAALAQGVRPIHIRPQSLVAYWPLIGTASPEPDLMGAAALTVTDATGAVHPRVSGRQTSRIYLPATAAPTFKSAWARSANQLIA